MLMVRRACYMTDVWRDWRDGIEVAAAVNWALRDYGVETYSAARSMVRFIMVQRRYRWVGIYTSSAWTLDPVTKTMCERETELRLLSADDGRPEPILTLQRLLDRPRAIIDQHRMWALIEPKRGLLGAIEVVSANALRAGDLRYLGRCARELRAIYLD